MLLPITACTTDEDRRTMTVQEIVAKADLQPVARISGRDVLRTDLSAAFDLVKDAKHWKNPIDCKAQLTGDQVELVRDAVIHFAGCEPRFVPVAGQSVQFDNGGQPVLTYHITADGYFRTIGA